MQLAGTQEGSYIRNVKLVLLFFKVCGLSPLQEYCAHKTTYVVGTRLHDSNLQRPHMHMYVLMNHKVGWGKVSDIWWVGINELSNMAVGTSREIWRYIDIMAD